MQQIIWSDSQGSHGKHNVSLGTSTAVYLHVSKIPLHHETCAVMCIVASESQRFNSSSNVIIVDEKRSHYIIISDIAIKVSPLYSAYKTPSDTFALLSC